MLLRKLYLKIRLFSYSIRKPVARLVTFSIIAILFYSFVNNLIFERIIFKEAEARQANKKYDDAIQLYNIAFLYYKLNHFSQANQEYYFEIPYQISVCYLQQNKKLLSVDTMMQELTAVQTQYGIFSKEAAYFVRRYLIAFYLQNNNVALAQKEFNNLMIIYKNIGYSGNEMADMIRIGGDIYYAKKDYDTAMNFYEQAYKSLSMQAYIDYEVFANVVNKICDYNVLNHRYAVAVNFYKSSINILKTAGSDQDEVTAQMLLKLGDLYASLANPKSNEAIECYEEAITLIKRLPKASYLRQNITVYYKTLRGLYNQTGQFHKVEDVDVELARRDRFSFFY